MIVLNKTELPDPIVNEGVTSLATGKIVRWDLQHTTYLYLFHEDIEVPVEEEKDTVKTIAFQVEISKDDSVQEALKKTVLQAYGFPEIGYVDFDTSYLSGNTPEEIQEFVEASYKELREIYGLPVTFDVILEDKLRELSRYDNSEAVNSFSYQGINLWLDKSTRVGLMNSTSIQKDLGETETTLWFSDISVTLPVDAVIDMLEKLEVYALKCYNVTAQHRNALKNLSSVSEILGYNYKTGYPEKLNF